MKTFFLFLCVLIQGDGDIALSIFVIFEVWVYLPTVLVIGTVTSRFFGQRTEEAKNRMMILGYMSVPSYGSTASMEEVEEGIEILHEVPSHEILGLGLSMQR